MGILESILAWFAGWVLKYLADKATVAVENKIAEVERDKERGQINDANVKAYEEASDRLSRIKAATSLLNRTKP